MEGTLTKKQRKSKAQPEIMVNMFSKLVAHNIQPYAETAISHKLMLAYAEKLKAYNYSPVLIAHNIIAKKNVRKQSKRNTSIALAAI